MKIQISAKCSDLFSMFGPKGEEYDGYVPEWFPDRHFGDYVMLDIDTKTGKILNWKAPTDAEVMATFKGGR